MNIKNNISYRNSDSPESTLNVKYKFKEGTKTIELNQNNTPKNIFLPKINNINRSNILRQQHFNSYTNENMDFFRLDYLKECDRNHYHNKYLSNLTPINRNENFDRLNENREKIKYLDSIKKNFLLKQEKNKKDFFKDNLYTSENIIKNNYYKKIDNRYNNNNNLYIKANSNSNNRYDRYNYNKNNNEKTIENENDIKLYKNISIETPKYTSEYSGAYLSNINDYSIKENQDINPDNRGNSNKNISKRSVLSKQSHLFCKDVINNDMPALFYKLYDYNMNNNGFKRQNNIFSNYMQNSNKPGGYLVRNIESNPYTPKNNITPSKKLNIHESYYSFSSKK